MVSGCKKDDPSVPVTPTPITVGGLSIETLTDLSSKDISSSGGEIIVSNSKTDLDGLKIEVPAGAYSDTKTFKISSGKIIKHDLGANFNPISPLIKISNGGGYANEIMKLTIPIKLPKNHFAMVFLYNEANKQLDFLPILSLTDDKIVVAATHFNRNNINKSGRAQADDDIDIIVTSTDEKNLDIEVNTNFIPGVDDWEFSNRGSIFSPDGFCSGMTRTAMYYFNYIKPKSGKSLWANENYGKRFIAGSTTPEDKLWFDNMTGIRYVTVVQENQWFKKFQNIGTLIKSGFTYKGTFDKAQFLQIAYLFLISENPSPIYLSVKAKDGTRHAVLVIGKTKKGLIVADPNRSGVKIELPYNSTTDIFGDYISGFDSKDIKGLGQYTDFTCLPRSFFDDAFITLKYKEVENGTIGDDVFEKSKSFDLVDTEEKVVKKLKNTLDVYGDFNIIYNDNGGEYAYRIYDTKGNKLHSNLNYNVTNTISLSKGQQTIGIATLKKASDGLYNWADFQWFDVNVFDPKVVDDKLYFSYELDGVKVALKDDGHTLSPPFNDALIRFSLDAPNKYFQIFANSPGISFNDIDIKGISDLSEIKAPANYKLFVKWSNYGASDSGVWLNLSGGSKSAGTGGLCGSSVNICETPGFLQIDKFDGKFIEGSFEFTYYSYYTKETHTCKNGKFRAKSN